MSGEVASPDAPLSHVVVRPADVDEFDDRAYCPVCQHRVDDTAGVHGIPRSIVDGAHLGVFETSDGVDVYGYRCTRHRVDHVLPAPASVAPDAFDSVSLALEGEFEVAAPPAVMERGGP